MRAKLVLVLLSAIIPAAFIVACSRDLPINEWLTGADSICRRAQADADNNPAPQSPLPGDKLRLSAKRTRDELEELKKLDAPAEQKSPVAEYLIVLRLRADALENYAQALDKAPAQGPGPSRATLEERTTEAYTQAQALGLDTCNGGVDFTVDTTSTSTSTAVATVSGTAPEDRIDGGATTVDG